MILIQDLWAIQFCWWGRSNPCRILIEMKSFLFYVVIHCLLPDSLIDSHLKLFHWILEVGVEVSLLQFSCKRSNIYLNKLDRWDCIISISGDLVSVGSYHRQNVCIWCAGTRLYPLLTFLQYSVVGLVVSLFQIFRLHSLEFLNTILQIFLYYW